MKIFRCFISVVAVIMSFFCLCFTAYSVDCIAHDFSCTENSSNVISNSDGTHSFVCLNGCGNVGTERAGVGGKEDCDYVLMSETQATCTQEGKRYYVCKVCFSHYTEVLPVIEHRYTISTTPPDCTDYSLKTFTCRDCSYSYCEKIKPMGHISDGGIVSDVYSDDEKITIIYSCRICGENLGQKTIEKVLFNEKKYKSELSSTNNFIDTENYSGNKTAEKSEITKVSGLKFSKKSKNKVRVRWKKVDCDGYQIFYSVKKSFSDGKTSKRNCVDNSIVLKKIKSKKYFVKIRAYKKVNGKKIYGPFSKVKSFKIKTLKNGY